MFEPTMGLHLLGLGLSINVVQEVSLRLNITSR